MKADAKLVAAILAGDRSAYAELVTRHERTVRAVAYAVLADHHAAQDVAQETFLHAYKKLATLRNGAAFNSWVRKIARNRALSVARRGTRTASIDNIAEPAATEPDRRFEQAGRDLVEAARRLPEHERTVVMLKYFDGHQVGEISEMLNCPVGTITGRLSRARTRLRKLLKEYDQ